MPERIYNPITTMGVSAMLPFSWTTLRGKHCRHPIAVMGVVDTFGHSLICKAVKNGPGSLQKVRRLGQWFDEVVHKSSIN